MLLEGQALKSMQFVFKVCEGAVEKIVHACAEDSKSWHEECVRLSGEEQVVKVTVNIDGNAKPPTPTSNTPMIANKLTELQKSGRFIQRSCNRHGSEGPVENNRLAEFDNTERAVTSASCVSNCLCNTNLQTSV